MPKGRGGKASHKGRGRHFLTEEEVRQSEEKKQREKEWKRKKGLGEDSDESEESDTEPSRGMPGDLPPGDSDEEETSSEEDEKDKRKGVAGLIEVENPNRAAKKNIKARDVDVNAKVQLSRREREEIERQRAAESHRRLHEAGKTEEAQKDLARLAIIRQQREQAAKKKEAERKAKEAAEQEQRRKKK